MRRLEIKRRLIWIAAICMAVEITCAQETIRAKDAVPNAGFEEAGIDWISSPPNRLKLDSEEKHSGRQSLRIEVPKGENTYVNMGTAPIFLSPNRLYNLKLWIKAEPIRIEVYFKAIGAGTNGFWRPIGIWQTMIVPPMHWAEIALPFITCPTTEHGSFYLRLSSHPGAKGTQYCWIDDLELLDLGELKRNEASSNLLDNSGFETIGSDTNTVKDWHGWFRTEALRVITDPLEAHGGQRYLKVMLKNNAERVLLAGQGAAVEFPAVCKMSVWAKGKGKIVFGIDRYTQNNIRVGPVFVGTPGCYDALPVTSEWKQYTAELPVDLPDVTGVTYLIDIYGDVSLDDASWQVISCMPDESKVKYKRIKAVLNLPAESKKEKNMTSKFKAWTLAVITNTLVQYCGFAGSIPIDTYQNNDDVYPQYQPLAFPVQQGLPETRSEIRQAYPELEETYNRFIEYGMYQSVPEFVPVWLETPHVNWAKPYAGGKIKALFVKYSRGSSVGGEDIREICERMDIEPTIMIVPSGQGKLSSALMPVGADYVNKRALELLSKDYDVVVLNNHVQGLSEEVLLKLEQKIKAGMGMVFLHATGGKSNDCISGQAPLLAEGTRGMDWLSGVAPNTTGHFVTEGIPFHVFPATRITYMKPAVAAKTIATLNDAPLAAVGQLGKGRTVAFSYDSMGIVGSGYAIKEAGNQSEKSYPWWEYNFSLLARAIIWAAKKEPQVALHLPRPEGIFPYGKQVGLSLELEAPEGKKQQNTIYVKVRDSNYREELSLKKTVSWKNKQRFWLDPGNAQFVPVAEKDGESKNDKSKHVFKPGIHFVDVLVKNENDKAVNWASTTFIVSEVIQADMRLSKEILKPDDEFSVEMKFKTLCPVETQDLRVRVQGLDSWGRLIGIHESPLALEKPVAFAFQAGKARSTIIQVKTELSAGGNVIFEKTLECDVPKFGWDDWKTIIWNRNLQFYGWRHELEAYRALGYDAAYLPTWPHRIDVYRKCAEVGLEPMAVGWNHAEIKKNKIEEILKRYGGIFLSVGDEWHPGLWGEWDLPFGSKARKDREAFLEWLKKRYAGDIRRLNESWGTAFQAWDEFSPLKTSEVLEKKKYAGWLEPRIYFDESTADDFNRIYREYQDEMGHQIMVGFDGCFGFQGTHIGGMDYSLLCDTNRTIGLYGADTGHHGWGHVAVAEIVRSFSPPWTLFSLTSGSCYGEKPTYDNDPWLIAFLGGRGWATYFAGTITSDFGALYRRGTWIRDATRELREGIAKMLMQTEPETATVGVLYSAPSLYLHELMAKGTNIYPNVFAWHQGRHAFVRILRDMQVPFRFVRWKNPSPESLNGIRVLCLTGCEVLPEAWVDVLKGFVEKGGVVLADLPPGLYDDHGNPRKENRFDQLFGIKNSGNICQMSPWYSAGFTELSKATNFPMRIGTWYPVSVYAPDTEVTDGIILGVNYVPDKKPAFVYKEHGSGMTLVANFLFDGYASNPHQYYRDLMDALLKRSGCELSSAAYNPDDGSILQRRFVNRFSTAKGQIEHLTIAGAKEYPDKIRIAFKRQGHLYDVREKRYLGYTNETLIAGTDHKIISSLPYRIEKLDIICPRAVKRGEDIEVTMVLSGSASECFDHVVRLEVFDPEGCIVPQYCMNVVAKKGKATIRIPLAFNDKKGPWTVKTREVISSIENKKGFEVE